MIEELIKNYRLKKKLDEYASKYNIKGYNDRRALDLIYENSNAPTHPKMWTYYLQRKNFYQMKRLANNITKIK